MLRRIYPEKSGCGLVATIPSLWLHVDAAWAGLSMACPEHRDLCLLDDINKYADSLCTNFHKVRLFSIRTCSLNSHDVSPHS